jgi:hypothetical protein
MTQAPFMLDVLILSRWARDAAQAEMRHPGRSSACRRHRCSDNPVDDKKQRKKLIGDW